MHKIEQENAEALFGKLKQNSWKFNQVKKGGCPLCRQDVSGYAIDHTFQTLVFSLDSQTLNSFATLPHKAQPTFKLIKAAPHEASISTLFQQLFCC
jgi:hypothetical protein